MKIVAVTTVIRVLEGENMEGDAEKEQLQQLLEAERDFLGEQAQNDGGGNLVTWECQTVVYKLPE